MKKIITAAWNTSIYSDDDLDRIHSTIKADTISGFTRACKTLNIECTTSDKANIKNELNNQTGRK